MARRMRALDWSQTPVGSPETWPQHLRTALAICVTVKFPAQVWWGPELTLFYNDASTALLRDEHPAALGKSAREAWPTAWPSIEPMIEEVMAGNASSSSDDILLSLHGTRSQQVYVTFSLGPLIGAGDKPDGVYCACRATNESERLRAEVTSQIERANAALAESGVERDTLRHQLVVAEEEERRRLARDLHDEVGQHLTSLGLGLQSLTEVAVPGSEAEARVEQLRELVNTMGRELHGLAIRLRPKTLDDFGLEAAVTTYAEEWTRRTGIRIDIHADTGAERLPSAIESAVYRVVQEGLTNVARHSGATHAGVVVERRDGSIMAIVEDSGVGFDSRANAVSGGERRGLGLLGVRERAAMLGGTVEIETSPGGGTTLFVRIPIEPPEARLRDD